MRVGLQLKLTLLIAAVVALATVVIVALHVRDSRASLEDQLQKRGATVARNLAISARLGVLSDDRQALGELAGASLGEPDVIFVSVSSPDGTRIAGTARAPRGVEPLRGASPGDAPRLRIRQHGDRRVLEATAGVFVAQAAPEVGAEDALFAMEGEADGDEAREPTQAHLEGLVTIGMSFADTDRRTAAAQEQSLIVAAIVALLGLAAAMLVARLATRRIAALIRVSQRMARGELDERLPERSGFGADEIEDLAVHFNVMADAIARQRAAITAANEELTLHNAEIQKASTMKSAFLATMSHELRTPLNAIIGFTRLVLKKSGADLPQKQRENLQKVEGSAVGLLAIINDILDLSKVEAGRMAVVAEALDPVEVARDVVANLEPLAKAKSIRLAVEDAGAPRATMSDPTRLRQILTNLLSNAIKFTMAGEVVVRTSQDPATHEIVFAVRDTGIGIAAQEVDRVFEPFHQVDGSTTRAAGGTGLGLAIVREMAKLLGGTVAVQSKVGVGSTFSVRIPLRSVTAAGRAKADEGTGEAKVADGI